MTRTERIARRTATRNARRVLRERAAATRLVASLNRGRALATHLIVAGVDAETAQGVASGLRSVAKRLNMTPADATASPRLPLKGQTASQAKNPITHRAHRTAAGKTSRLRVIHHYTPAQVATLAAAYRPRKPEYKAAMALLAA